MEKEFIESLCMEKGEIQNLAYHQERVTATFNTFFKTSPFQIKEALAPFKTHLKEKLKIRIEYTDQVNKIEIKLYKPQKHKKFRCVDARDFQYPFKFKNRDFLTSFKDIEPIFVQNNKITDTSYSNLVFYKEGIWFTPTTFLLNGTKRQQLLAEGLIKEKEITTHNLQEFEKFGLINALLNPEENVYPIDMLESKSV